MWLVPGEIMSSLRRSISAVNDHVYEEFKRIAASEPVAGAFFMDSVGFTADYIKSRQKVLVQMFYKNKSVWRCEMALSAAQVELKGIMDDDAFTETITKTMRDHLNIVSQMHYARLDAQFPNSIRDVCLEYDMARAVRKVAVRFKNGHIAECDEAQIKTEEFLARCMMLYDLPALIHVASPE